MKICRYCKEPYPESYFGVALTTHDKVYYRHKCKFCYQDTKNLLRRKYGKWLIDYKTRNGCKICRVSDPRVLEFHHRDKSKKDFSVSFGYYNRYGLDKMKREIGKCDILCANCHRILHFKENNWQ